VGAALTPGQFASFALRPGAVVDAIRTGESGAPGQIVSTRAIVYEVRELKDATGTWIVSLVVPEADVSAVASAASAKHLTIALVGATAP